MRKLYLLFLGSFIPFLSNAQSNYKPGYVVTPKGDTIKGFIDYREWDRTPASFNFKHLPTDNNVAKYGPMDVSYVGIDKLEAFASYTGRISMDLVSTDKGDYGRDTTFKVATVFLKVLEKGSRISMYEYKDDIKARYFISEGAVYEPKELIFKSYINPNFASNTNPNASRVISENTFQKQLSGYALKNNELNSTMEAYIGRSEYAESDILKIVSMINHVSKADYDKTHYSGPTLNFFIGAGIDINTTSPDPVGAAYAAGARSYTSILPQGSVGINMFANPATRKLQFRVELGIAEVKYKSLYMSKVTPYVPTEISYNELALSGSVQVLYNFYNADNFKVFAGGGIVFYKLNYSNIYFGSQNHDGSVDQVAANNPFFFEKGDNAFIVRAGVQFAKNLVITGSYQTPVNNTNGGYFRLSSTSAQVGLNYLFEFKRK